MTNTDQPKALTRMDARAYLASIWGIQLSATYLAGATKTGPRYSVISRRAYYLVDDLDSWARENFGIELDTG